MKITTPEYKISFKLDEAKDPFSVLIIAHGAGAGMQHSFLEQLAKENCLRGSHSIRFNFPYMESGRKSPGSPKRNIEAWKVVLDYVRKKYPDLPIFISGKSYGGRMASHLVVEHNVSVNGIIYFGFPLHAPGRDSKERAAHLSSIEIPQLFLQGTKDKLANIELMREVNTEQKEAELVELTGADHSFNVPKRVGISKEEVINNLVDQSIKFQKKHS